VPAAPTNLSASRRGANVTLNWTDNATNETAQSIYMATGSGAFAKVTDVAASQTGVTLTGFGNSTYRFYVVAYNSAGTSAQSNTASVTIGSSINAAFTYTPTTGTAGITTFTFTDQTSGTITSRIWNFGDGTTGSAATVSHVYASAGTYTITLTINGSAQVSHSVSVTAPSVNLTAAFGWSPAAPTTASSIAFVDQSTGGATSWQWSFGDGTSSSLQSPVKQYANGGNYTVTLTIFRSGAASSSVSHGISIATVAPAQPPVVATFAFSPNAPTTGQSIAFTDQSTGTPIFWQWNFGDGTTSTQQNPTHAYATPGDYTVTMIVANSTSTSSATRAVNVVSSAVPYRALVSVITQAQGVGGSSWRTELTIFNAGTEAVTPQLIFFPGAGGQVQTHPIYLAPKQSVTYANALLELFGLQNSAGALGIEADGVVSSPDLRISSRTFTDSASGTYGQAVNGVLSDDLPATVYLTGLESDASFRTNIGLVNRTIAPVGVTLELFDQNGNRIGVNTTTLAGNNFSQSPLSAFFPNISGAQYATLSMRVTAAASNVVSAYASIVDNRSQDPVYVQGSGAPHGGRLVVPAVGRVPGANGTFWRSDVTFYNPSSSTMSLALRYQPAGADNRFANALQLTVGAGKTLLLTDVLNWLGINSGSGALDVRWTSPAGPVVTSRTYTSTTGGGTYGQSIDPVTEFGNDAYVPGLRSDLTFRSNVGFVNGGDTTIGVTTQLLGTNGQTLATGFVALQPRSQTQLTLAQMFPSVNVQSLGSVTLKAHADGQPDMFAYGSIIDNTSGDPVFFAGR
jgi:PKD repeat protein